MSPKEKDSQQWPSDVRCSELVGAVAVISGKWKVQIVCQLLTGTKRFSELRRLLAGIGRGMLSYELRQLQTDGVIARKQYPTIPPQVEYWLTERGRALEPVLEELGRWSQECGPIDRTET